MLFRILTLLAILATLPAWLVGTLFHYAWDAEDDDFGSGSGNPWVYGMQGVLAPIGFVIAVPFVILYEILHWVATGRLFE